jgi:hypothetical protein
MKGNAGCPNVNSPSCSVTLGIEEASIVFNKKNAKEEAHTQGRLRLKASKN